MIFDTSPWIGLLRKRLRAYGRSTPVRLRTQRNTVVSAMRFDGVDASRIATWTSRYARVEAPMLRAAVEAAPIDIVTSDGAVEIAPQDFVVRDTTRAFVARTPHEFEALYEVVI